ncbi:M48 family metalloprotease [Mycobacterium sp.]|uniref:M48 family metalloprotease n=1 Tax=Mycobacterium sp. TaxID=1785 RepID=UPI0025DF13E1|nr:M48 family metalloprotease [Mycobacterium sp.]
MISVVVGLLLYSVAMLTAAPRLLRALTDSGNAPRLGVATWLSAIGTVVLSWVATAVLVIIGAVTHWTHPRTVAASCLARLQHTISGDAGTAPQIALILISAAAIAAAAYTGMRLTTAVLGIRSRAYEHASAVRLVGHHTGEADVVMIDAAKPAAYCVAGRPPAIVVTSAARVALDDRQMAAVLAHERAHLAGHHSAIVSTLRALAGAFPRLSLITEGARQVARLLEMCADDVAARRHSSRALLTGLVALTAAAPAEALSAADLAVLARAERLAAPAQPSVKVKTRVVLASVIAMMAAAPLIAISDCIWRSHIWGPGMGSDGNTAAGEPLMPYAPSTTMRHSQSGKVMSMMMMNHGHWGWGGWLLTTGTTIVFWALVITAVALLARYLLSLPQRTPTARAAAAMNAEHTLAERYARGEIDDDEYQRRLGLLRENTASSTQA